VVVVQGKEDIGSCERTGTGGSCRREEEGRLEVKFIFAENLA
jgi:hypothetical protein